MRRMLVGAVMVALCVSPTVLAAAPEPPAPAPTPAAPAPAPTPAEPTPTAPAPAPPSALPDGLFVGALGGSTRATLRVSVTAGVVTWAELRREKAPTIRLRPGPSGTPLGLMLVGREGRDYLKVMGQMLDAETGSGTFEGALEGKQHRGTWTLLRH